MFNQKSVFWGSPPHKLLRPNFGRFFPLRKFNKIVLFENYLAKSDVKGFNWKNRTVNLCCTTDVDLIFDEKFSPWKMDHFWNFALFLKIFWILENYPGKFEVKGLIERTEQWIFAARLLSS